MEQETRLNDSKTRLTETQTALQENPQFDTQNPKVPIKKSSLMAGIIALFLILLGLIGFAVSQNQRLGKQNPQTPSTPAPPAPATLSALSEFVKMASRFARPATGEMTGGIVPEPPRAFLKEAERFAEKWVKSPAKTNYTFFDSVASPSSSNSLVVYVAPDPFRWRVDFNTNRENIEYKTIYLFDGSGYSSCNVTAAEPPECYQALPKFLEAEIQTPIPLTEFLNSLLDSRILSKLLPEITNLERAQEQNGKREIAGYSTKCKIVKDEYRIFDFCVDEEANLLLYLDVKNTTTTGKVLGQFTLTAQDIDLVPDLQEAFILP
ncbi:MAG TPA: hypothetical protein VMW41_02240 [Candidatus Bathyarchaeia archaeon]|nr:hypothetical protein [Candidatus Bathyarchaeia archaeon]